MRNQGKDLVTNRDEQKPLGFSFSSFFSFLTHGPHFDLMMMCIFLSFLPAEQVFVTSSDWIQCTRQE